MPSTRDPGSTAVPFSRVQAWEVYVTDPAEHPDPKEWKTEICWPIR